MRVHIVKSEDTWIINRVAHAIRLPNLTISREPTRRADINFFVNYHAFGTYHEGTLNVPWMTHLPSKEDDGGFRRRRFFNVANKADYCIAMSQNTAMHCPPHKTVVWGGAVDPKFLKKKLIIGVSSKISRRKRPDRINALKKIPGVEVRVTGGKLPFDQLPGWFRELDYLVVTSDTEGGPYSVLEAIAAGVPVIAPDVGWCWEHPVIRYDGTTKGLIETVKALRPDPDPWAKASKALEQIFTKMLDGKLTLASDSSTASTETFRYRSGGIDLPYCLHPHNCGLSTDRRRTERTVELSIADHWLRLVGDAGDAEVVEIGAVSPYYWGNRIKTVVDPADKQATLRDSLFNCDFSGAAVLSISTLEHIGEPRYGLRENETPLTALKKLMKEAPRFLVTVPYGWRTNPSFPEMQDYLLNNRGEELAKEGVQVFTVSRRSDETWCPSTDYRPYGSPPKSWANTVIVVEKGGLL